MSKRKASYSIIFILFFFCLILAGIIFYSQKQDLKVIFLDVGQGDAILIEKGNSQMLIDGGPDGQQIMEKLGLYMPFWDRKIEVVIATHPDADHISGLVEVLKNYQVGEIIDNGQQADSQVFKKYKELIQTKNISEVEGQTGTKIKIGDRVELEILSPDGSQEKDNPKDTNGASIISRLIVGDNSFLFTGDLPIENEFELISKKLELNSRVLKVAHHGSKYSTSLDFLDAVRPETAIISVGKNNRYGHPAPETMERLKVKNINILRTDEVGDIEYVCRANAKCISGL